MNRPTTKEITALQIQIVKGILDINPEVRTFARGYLVCHHPEEKDRLFKVWMEECGIDDWKDTRLEEIHERARAHTRGRP